MIDKRVLILVALLPVLAYSQIGCGEEVAEGETCADWQCSRNHSHFCVKGFDEHMECDTDGDCYRGLLCTPTNETIDGSTVHTCTKKPHGTKDPAMGFLGAVLAVLGFGSSFVPIKKYKKFAGNGVFAQFCMCFGRFMFGLVMLLTRENQQFYPAAALGGLFWSGGNAISVPIIQCIGMGLGIAIWGTTNMLIGWASGAFGWWGVKKEVPETPWLSYLSVFLSFCSIVLFLLVEPNQKPNDPVEEEEEGAEESERKSLQETNEEAEEEKPMLQVPEKRPTIAEQIGKTKARIIGVSLALIAGALFGLCMDPAQRMMSNYEHLTETSTTKYSPFGFDYVFSFNVGAIAFSFIWLSGYQVMVAFGFHPGEKLFNPVEHSKIILPAFANGIIGSSASAAWFLANQNLGLIVSFPIIGAGPGIVSALWGVLVFGEIKGAKNLIVLACAFVLIVGSSLCSAFSSKDV